jgi:hypothetical protein
MGRRIGVIAGSGGFVSLAVSGMCRRGFSCVIAGIHLDNITVEEIKRLERTRLLKEVVHPHLIYGNHMASIINGLELMDK